MPPSCGLYAPRGGTILYYICRYRNVRPQALPAESHSFVGMARETAAMPLQHNEVLHLYRWYAHTHTGSDLSLRILLWNAS